MRKAFFVCGFSQSVFFYNGHCFYIPNHPTIPQHSPKHPKTPGPATFTQEKKTGINMFSKNLRTPPNAPLDGRESLQPMDHPIKTKSYELFGRTGLPGFKSFLPLRNCQSLENKLLLIFINFTPKTSHSSLKNGTMVHYVFQVVRRSTKKCE